MGKLKQGLRSIQQILLLIVGVAVVFFAFLNLDPVAIDLFFIQVETSVALLLLVSLLAGMLLGWVGGRTARRRKESRKQERSTLKKQPEELASGQDPLTEDDWAELDLDEIET